MSLISNFMEMARSKRSFAPFLPLIPVLPQQKWNKRIIITPFRGSGNTFLTLPSGSNQTAKLLLVGGWGGHEKSASCWLACCCTGWPTVSISYFHPHPVWTDAPLTAPSTTEVPHQCPSIEYIAPYQLVMVCGGQNPDVPAVYSCMCVCAQARVRACAPFHPCTPGRALAHGHSCMRLCVSVCNWGVGRHAVGVFVRFLNIAALLWLPSLWCHQNHQLRGSHFELPTPERAMTSRLGDLLTS